MTRQTMLTKTEQELLAEAMDWRGEPKHVLIELESPNWESCDPLYGDWEFCVPRSVSDRWAELSLEAKLIAYLVGRRGAALIPEPSES